MNLEQRGADRVFQASTSLASWSKTIAGSRFLQPGTKLWRSRGDINVSLGFYLGVGVLLLLLVASAVTYRGESPLVDQHANPIPAGAVPAEVVVDPGSHLYHAGTSCPYVHRDAQLLSKSEALLRGLVPCPYCLGNSSARLIPTLGVRPF